MLSNSEQKERNYRIAAIAGTILFHAIIVVVLLLLALRTPGPAPGGESVEVNSGYNEDSISDSVPETEAMASDTTQEAIQDNVDELMLSGTAATTPSSDKNSKKAAKPESSANPKAIVETPDELRVFHKTGNQGKSVKTLTENKPSVSGKPAEKAKPKVTPPQPAGAGNTESSNGVSYNLDGRGIVNLSKPISYTPEQGKIVVSIIVNREGKVVFARAGAKGTTIPEINPRMQAESAARRTLFKPDANAPEEHRGTITYDFVKQN